MPIEITSVESENSVETVTWAIMAMQQWFDKWKIENIEALPKEFSQKEIARFIRISWEKGDPLPSSMNWDHDTLTLCELLCVVSKKLHTASRTSQGNQRALNGGLLYWILEGVVEAARHWNIACGSRETIEIISMIQWMEGFAMRTNDAQLSNMVHKIKEALLISFSYCDPDIVHIPTLKAYTTSLENIQGFFLEFHDRPFMEDIVKRLNAIKRDISSLSSPTSPTPPILNIISKIFENYLINRTLPHCIIGHSNSNQSSSDDRDSLNKILVEFSHGDVGDRLCDVITARTA